VIVLDANVLIAHLDRRDEHHARATELLLEVADQQFGASSITVAPPDARRPAGDRPSGAAST